MKDGASRFFRAFTSFRKLKISTMLPNLNHADFATLNTIVSCKKQKDGAEVTVSDIARELRVAPPAVSRCLKSLGEKGYVERTVNNKDRRNTYIQLTDLGQHKIEEGKAIMDDFSKAVFSNMGEENMERLTMYLEELEKTCEREIAQRKYKKEEEK